MSQKLLFPDIRESIFSPCRLYRYTLWRTWGVSDRYVNFIALNPSTADETNDDPTMRRCIGFAKDWGYDSMCMTNLYAYRSTDSSVIKKVSNPVGDENDRWLIEIAADARLIIAAWGTKGTHLKRDVQVKRMFESRLFCIRMTAAGHPEHPLYLPKILRPELFN